MSQQPATNGYHSQSQSQPQSQNQNRQQQQSPYQTTLTTLLTHPSGHIFFSPPTSPHKLLLPQSGRNLDRSIPTISSLSLHPTIESILHILNGDLPSAHFLCRHAEVAPKWESMYVHGMLHRVEGDIDNTRAWYGNVKDTEVFKSVWGGDDGEGVVSQEGEEIPEIAKGGWKHFLDRLERYRDRSARRQKMRRKSKDDERSRRVPNTEEDNDKDHLDTSATSPSPSRSTTSSKTSTSISNSPITDWSAEEIALRATSLWEILRVLRFCERKFGTGVVENAKGEFLGRIESGDLRLQKIAESMVTGGEGWRVF